jgi:hypothetical protein
MISRNYLLLIICVILVCSPTYLWALNVTQPCCTNIPYIPALFQISHQYNVTGKLVISDPPTCCDYVNNGDAFRDSIVIAVRGECNFTQKILLAQVLSQHT